MSLEVERSEIVVAIRINWNIVRDGNMHRLDGLDAGFLYMESESQHMHTLKVIFFDPPADGQECSFAGLLAELKTIVDRYPPLRWRLAEVPLGLYHPVCYVDPDFDIRKHVSSISLPPDSEESAVYSFIEEIASVRLERDKPLWHLWILDGLRNRQTAVIFKTHHALMDGVANAAMLAEVLGGEGVQKRAPANIVPERVPGRAGLFAAGAGELLRDLRQYPKRISAIRAARKWAKAQPVASAMAPPRFFSAPPTLFNKCLTPRRKFAFATLSCAAIKEVGRQHGATVNDVLLTMLAQTIRDYLGKRNALPEDALTAAMAFSVRDPVAENSFGNKVRIILVSLCTTIENPIERLKNIHQRSVVAKEIMKGTKHGRAATLLAYLPPLVRRPLVRSMMADRVRSGKPPMYTVGLSNIPGPRIDSLGFQGRRVDRIFTAGPLGHGACVTFTAWSHGDKLNLTVQSCSDVVPEPGEMRDSMLMALEMLKERSGAAESIATECVEDAVTS